MSYSKRAFTLIELLVVIAIIGLLATIISIAVNSARAKARDAKRVSELQQLKLAVEMYYDKNNSYPSTGGNWWGECPSYGSHTDWIPGIGEYIAKLPQDPSQDCSAYRTYLYVSNGTDYKILDYHGPDNANSQTSLIDCRYHDSWSISTRQDYPAPCLP